MVLTPPPLRNRLRDKVGEMDPEISSLLDRLLGGDDDDNPTVVSGCLRTGEDEDSSSLPRCTGRDGDPGPGVCLPLLQRSVSALSSSAVMMGLLVVEFLGIDIINFSKQQKIIFNLIQLSKDTSEFQSFLQTKIRKHKMTRLQRRLLIPVFNRELNSNQVNHLI